MPKVKKKPPYKKRKFGSNAPLTPEDRAKVLIEKDLRITKGTTNADIATQMGIGLDTVNRITKTSVDPTVLEIYERKKERLAEKALDVTLRALEKGEELIDLATDPKALAGIAQMGRFADTVHRLERGEPTQITNNIDTEAHALAFIQFMMGKMSREAALEAFKRADLQPLVAETRKNEILARIESGELRLLTP